MPFLVIYILENNESIQLRNWRQMIDSLICGWDRIKGFYIAGVDFLSQTRFIFMSFRPDNYVVKDRLNCASFCKDYQATTNCMIHLNLLKAVQTQIYSFRPNIKC